MSDRPQEPAEPQPIVLSAPPVEPAPPPEATIADGQEHSLDPQSVFAARLTGGIWSAIVASVLFLALLIVLFSATLPLPIKLMLLATWAVVSGLLAFLAIWWPAKRYRFIFYRVGLRGLRIRRGVVWRAVISVPKSRVQHTDVSQGPIERIYGLATLTVHTAGTHNASVDLGGLPHDVALRIRDHLLGGMEDDAV